MDKEYAKYLLDKTRQDYNLIASQFSSTRRFIWRGLEPLYNYALPREKVLDLGCGTGRLALAASYLGAQCVVGVDIDEMAIKAASENLRKAELETNVSWVVGDISAITGNFDTVLQNPPFGVQKRAADRKFLEKALGVGNVVYSLHNHPHRDKQLIKRLKANPERLLQVAPSPFIAKFIESHHGVVKAVYAMLMTIPHMFDFHTKMKYDFVIDLYLIKRSK